MQKGMFGHKEKNPGGFTLIEVLMVATIIGVMLAVIIPRAFRAQVDTKYNIVRQTAAELGKWGMTWAERNLEAQSENDICKLNDYVAELDGYIGDSNAANNYWTTKGNPSTDPQGPILTCREPDSRAAMSVEAIMPEDKKPKNPFNGVSYFEAANSGTPATNFGAGVLYLLVVEDPNVADMMNYFFVYLGTDSTSVSDWTAGMKGLGLNPVASNDQNLQKARNGIFMARLAQ